MNVRSKEYHSIVAYICSRRFLFWYEVRRCTYEWASQIGKNVKEFNADVQVFAGASISLGANAEYICLSQTSLVGEIIL